MKIHSIRKILVLSLVIAALIFTLAACSSKEDTNAAELLNTVIAERNDLKNKTAALEAQNAAQQGQIAALQAQMAGLEAKDPEIRTETVEKVVEKEVKYAIGVLCTVNGEDKVLLKGETKLVCVPKEQEGMAFDHWNVNGKVYPQSGRELTLSTAEPVAIVAEFRPRKVLTCINCHFQFVNKSNKANGNNYTEFDFEDAYTNPVTKEQCEGGTITCYVTAEIPRNKQVDYWLINGVPYHPANDFKGFRVENLDEATTYEPIFKNEVKKKTASPTPFQRMIVY